uniref:SCP domain-containing protein n=1 Tax=Caenorhabditis tropicalis TaxID=1561998 RepID=A0A1I7TY72_9PELO
MKFAFLWLAIIGIASAKFSPTAQEAIVQAHNDLRSAIAKGEYVAKGQNLPPATNMLKMEWDSFLAASAQEYTEGCPSTHLHDKSYGENIHRKWSSDAPTNLDGLGVTSAKSWEKEFQKLGLSFTVYTGVKGIGHATQMAWAHSNLIGCGVKNCGRDPLKRNMYKVVVICRYKPKGNFKQTEVYNPGDTCSSCPSDTKCDSDSGLCV